MEENIGQVADMLGNLRNMAIDMGSEVGAQNQQLDRINQKVIFIELPFISTFLTGFHGYHGPNEVSYTCKKLHNGN